MPGAQIQSLIVGRTKRLSFCSSFVLHKAREYSEGRCGLDTFESTGASWWWGRAWSPRVPRRTCQAPLSLSPSQRGQGAKCPGLAHCTHTCPCYPIQNTSQGRYLPMRLFRQLNKLELQRHLSCGQTHPRLNLDWSSTNVPPTLRGPTRDLTSRWPHERP